MNRFALFALAISASMLAWGASLAGSGPDGGADLNRIVDGMIHEQSTRFDRLEAYWRIQRYSVDAERFDLKAEMVVRIHRDRLKGKTYEIISRSGSPTIQSHVFDPLLQAEIESSHQTGELLRRENYSFRLAGEEERAGLPCWVLETEPRHKDKRLLKGKLWLDKADFGVVHVEGRSAESLSFWVGRPMIVQDYLKLDGYWWVSQRQAHSDGFLTGKSDLTIDYTDYQFETRSVDHPVEVTATH
jgi:hypothetical protein